MNLLILPTLEKYTGTVRYAFKSRGWKTGHDGMSFSVWDMEWVEGGEAESRGGGGRKRRLDEREWVRRTGGRDGAGVWLKGVWREGGVGPRVGA